MDLQEILKQQLLIIESLDILPSGKVRFGGKAGGVVDVDLENPIGNPRRVRARCGSDCPPGKVQLVRLDTGEYVAFSPSAARPQEVKSVERSSSKKGKLVKKEDEEIWPVTSCFLHCELNEEQVDFTDNLATDLTSYDAWQSLAVAGSLTNEQVILFSQRSDTEGDYETANDALANNLKENRKLKPGNTGAGGGGNADNTAWDTKSPDAVIVWFYIGELNNDSGAVLASAGDGQIFKVSGVSGYEGNENTEYGPGFCMEMYRSGSISVGLYPIVRIGQEPLSFHLKKTFPNLGGKIGYWGNVYTWRGTQDDYRTSNHHTYLYRLYWSGIQGIPQYPGEDFQTPTSFPPEHNASITPWTLEDASWYRYGWDYPNNRIGCMSGGAIVAITSAITGSFSCGDTVPHDKWYWAGGIGSSAGALDKRAHYSSANGMFACWQGHKDNIGLAQSFWEAFRVYWKIPGGVKTLRSVNVYGCGVGVPGNATYPPPPPGLRRFLTKQYGRKASIYLTVCEKNYEPIKLKLPFEFAALIEKIVVQDAPPLDGLTNNTQNVFYTLATVSDCRSLELVHATMSTDGKFVYIDILYGGERDWEEPLSMPIPCKLSNLGTGNFSGFHWNRRLGHKENNARIVGEYTLSSFLEISPRYKSDHFSYCQSYIIAIPTSPTNRNLSIVGSQKYRRGETIQLTAKSPDNEFNNKYLIYDFRTDKIEDIPLSPSITNMAVASWQLPNEEYASFGGLPALIQTPIAGYEGRTLEHFNAMEKFYKPQATWTDMDKIHYELQEAPVAFWPLNTVLPENVFVSHNKTNELQIRFMLDGKFGRSSRAESIDNPSAFGYAYQIAPTYSSYSGYGRYLLFTSFKEQLIGNGIKNDEGLVVIWNRVCTSSFPIFGQLARNIQ